MTDDDSRRTALTKSLSHSVGHRNLSRSSSSKASKLLGVSTDEVLEASRRKDLFRRRSSNDIDTTTGLEEDDELHEQHEQERTSTKSSTSNSSKWSRNDSVSSTTSTGSKFGGILKSRVKFTKARRATIDANLASSTQSEPPPQDSIAEGTATTRRGISWGSESEENVDSSDKLAPLDSRGPNPFPSPHDKPHYNLMERSMSRRTRKSFRVGAYNHKGFGVGGSTFYVGSDDPRATKGDPFNNALRINNCNNLVKHIRVNAILSNSTSSKDSDENNDQDSLTSLILKSLSKKRMCDVQLVGMDDVIVDAPSYLLGVHSQVLESMFFSSTSSDGSMKNEKKAVVVVEGEEEQFFDASCTSLDDFDASANESTLLAATTGTTTTDNIDRRVEIPFAKHTALKATLHFLATRSLPDHLENDANESNIRCICQIYAFGRLYKISSLQNHAYRIARLLMNKMPRLVCAAFDECIVSTKRLPEQRRFSSSSVDELMDCCLE